MTLLNGEGDPKVPPSAQLRDSGVEEVVEKVTRTLHGVPAGTAQSTPIPEGLDEIVAAVLQLWTVVGPDSFMAMAEVP